jgi:transcriptional regulator with XRE-family HTH domain
MLARTGATQEEIGAVAGTSRVAASHWLTGATKPNADRRARIAKRWPAVTIEGWDEAWGGEQAAQPERPPQLGLAGLRRGLEEEAAATFWKLKRRTDLTDSERAKALRELAVAVRELSRMPPGSLVDHPDWPELEAAIGRVLEGHPEVAQAFEDEMVRLEAGRVTS